MPQGQPLKTVRIRGLMPYIDASHYQHDLDRQTLDALRSIPGFTPLLKAFMKAYNERIVFFTTKSTHIEITPHQLSEYYDMVPPLCERLGIEVPTLYLANDVTMNAYTTNESSPIIVINTGTLQNCSKETIRAIFAHECGHIASHHVLYHSMGSMIMSGAAAVLPGVGGLVSVGLQAAYLAWSRASEFTADRAAAIALGSPDAVEDMCVELAGGWSQLGLDIDKELFMNQASEYEQAIQGDSVNKAFEVVINALEGTHPLNAYRALELRRWCELEQFENMQRFLRGEEIDASAQLPPLAKQTPEENVRAPESSVAMSQNFCGQCGASLKEGQKFCASCGSKCN